MKPGNIEHRANGRKSADTVAAGVSPAIESWRPARRNACDYELVEEYFRGDRRSGHFSGRRDARPLRQARMPAAT